MYFESEREKTSFFDIVKNANAFTNSLNEFVGSLKYEELKENNIRKEFIRYMPKDKGGDFTQKSTVNSENINFKNSLLTEGALELPYLKEGTLFKRNSDKRWEARIYIDGKQKTIATCKLQKDAYNKLKEAIALKDKTKINVNNKTIYFYDWLDTWFETYKKNKQGERTQKDTNYYINKIKDLIKNVALNKLNAITLQNALNKTNGQRAKKAIYDILKACIDKAYSLEYLKKNIILAVDKPEYKAKKVKALSYDKINKILEVCKTQLEKDIINYYLYTGCRPSEILRAKKEHVNLINNIIFIDGTKNDYAKREMPIMPQFKEILQRLYLNCTNYLFDITEKQLRSIIVKLKDKCDFNFIVKDFRHTFATICRAKGIPIEEYSRWLGHSTPEITRRVYTHESEEEKQIAQSFAVLFIL